MNTGFATLFFIALGLAMDAFAVSLTNGVTVRGFRLRHAFLAAAFFGFFQCMMPVLGWLLGTGANAYIKRYDHWIAFFLLTFIGGKMLWDSLHETPPDRCIESGKPPITVKYLTVQAVATSIDALAVGISFAALSFGGVFSLLNINIRSASLLIGVVAFLLSAAGGLLGKKIGKFFQKKAGVFGGAILILIGTKILMEHLFIQT